MASTHGLIQPFVRLACRMHHIKPILSDGDQWSLDALDGGTQPVVGSPYISFPCHVRVRKWKRGGGMTNFREYTCYPRQARAWLANVFDGCLLP